MFLSCKETETHLVYQYWLSNFTHAYPPLTYRAIERHSEEYAVQNFLSRCPATFDMDMILKISTVSKIGQHNRKEYITSP